MSTLKVSKVGLNSSENTNITIAGNDLDLTISANGAERIRVDSNGRVGIGNTTPDSNLTIFSNGATDIKITGSGPRVRINRNSVSGSAAIDFQTEGLFDWAVGSTTSNSRNLIFRTRNNGAPFDAIAITYESGNVGINVANATSKLHVVGDANITAGIVTTGNVLIGRTSSTMGQNVKLDIVGAVNASAFLVNGVAVGTGTSSGTGVGDNLFLLSNFV